MIASSTVIQIIWATPIANARNGAIMRVPEAEGDDDERPDAEQSAEDEPGDREVGERAAGQERHVEVHHAAVGRRDEGDAAGEGPDAEQAQCHEADLAGKGQLGPRKGDGGRAGDPMGGHGDTSG